MANSKLYKDKRHKIVSNLQIVNMLPGDRNGLPDAFNSLGGFRWKIL